MTNNGFDPRWISAINGVLADREVNLTVSDISHGLWDSFIGPMIDHIEQTAELSLLERDFELAGDDLDIHDVSVVLTYEPEADFLIDALTVAVEGGINYWAEFLAVERRETDHCVLSIKIRDAEDSESPVRDVSARDLARGIGVALEPTFRLRSDLRAAILAALVNNDAGELDADSADAIVQAAIFGHLVYG